MFHENVMLQNELCNLRTRVKAMQETIDALSIENTRLLAEKETGAWLNSGKKNCYSLVRFYILFCCTFFM